jgi:hypothetical protein
LRESLEIGVNPMSLPGIVIAKKLEEISDSFDVLKYSSFNDWEISIKEGQVEWWGEYGEGIQNEEEERKQEKRKEHKEKIFGDFKNGHYNEALVKIDEFFTYTISDVEISNLRSKINDIFDIKSRINKARNDRDFKKIQQEFDLLLDLNEDDEEAGLEKRFLDDALPFLDGSELETIDNLERCRDSITRISKLIKLSSHIYLDDLSRIYAQWIEYQKELERKEILRKLNSKIEQALTDEKYDEVSVLFREAQQYLRRVDEIIVIREQCEEYAKTEAIFKQALDKLDFEGAFKSLETLRKINPYPNGVILRIGYFEKYFRLCDELENEKDPLKLIDIIREKEMKPEKFPCYLKPGFEKVINETKERIEKEKSRLNAQVKEKREEKHFTAAAGLLKKVALLESDEQKRLGIASEIKRIKSEEIEVESFRRRRYVIAAGICILILILIGLVRMAQNVITKKEIINLMSEVRPSIERGAIEDAAGKLNRIFIERKKLNTAGDIDRNIGNILEMLFNKLMWDSPEDSLDLRGNKSKRVEKVKQVFKGFPAQMSSEWLRKADEILNLSLEFGKRMEAKQSGKALDVLVKLKRAQGKKTIPFELLHYVSYTNGSGYPEVDLNGIKFVYIKGGEFEIGCFNQGDRSFLSNAPLVSKTVSSFWISATEITTSQYDKKDEIYDTQPNFPRNEIDWEDASSFARGFGREYDLNSNLPTETQWEYTARNGGEKIVYPWGNSIDCSRANYRDCGVLIKPVGAYRPNRYGIFDLVGNLNEWCRDVYRENAYLLTGSIDPCYSSGDFGQERVVRGGSFADSGSALKDYSRYRKDKSVRDIYTGFRIVLESK